MSFYETTNFEEQRKSFLRTPVRSAVAPRAPGVPAYGNVIVSVLFILAIQNVS